MRRAPAVAVLLGLAVVVLSAGAAVLAGLGTRLGWWGFGTGFRVLRWGAELALAGALLSLLAALLAAVTRRWGLLVFALCGLGGGVVTAGVPWLYVRQARAVPAIHDITTDTEHPPAFVAVLPRRRHARNSAEYGGPVVAAQQKQGYPDLGPADFAAPPDQVFAVVEAAARKLGWEIVAAVPGEGRLEATATTFWFGFKDDVVVRVTPRDGGSRVDVRSVSRVGRSDIGANATRIRRFLRALRESRLPPAT